MATKTIERRICGKTNPVRLEKRADGKLPTITGYAAVFYDGTPGTEYDLGWGMIERVMPGAFDRAIREDDVRGLWNHDPSDVLGRTASGTMRLSVDKTGLKYEIDPPDTECGRECVALIERGDVTGSSFAFSPLDIVWREQGDLMIRELMDVTLMDCSPCTFPAYDATTANVSRSTEEIEDLRAEAAAWKAKNGNSAIPQSVIESRARVLALENS